MIDKVIIHIGIEKTATTSLQTFLRENKENLLKQGFFLPSAAGKLHQSLFALSFYRGNANFLKRHGLIGAGEQTKMRIDLNRNLRAELEALKTTPQAMIITSEWLHSKLTTSDEVEALVDFLKEFAKTVEVICYLKEQSALLNSRYSTHLKSGLTESFSVFVQNCSPYDSYYNHQKTVSRWAAATNESEFKCRIFAEKALIGRSIHRDFLAQIGADFEKSHWRKTPSLNQSLSFKGAMILRALNETLDFPLIKQKYKDAIFNALTGSYNFITETQYNRIDSEFSPSNEAVRKRFFPHKTKLFSKREVFNENGSLEDKLYPNVLLATQDILSRSGNQINDTVIRQIINLN